MLKLTDLKPYGAEVVIDKEECINHVSKRLGTEMRNLVQGKKKGGVVLGSRGKGKLTQRTMEQVQTHYANAIKSGKSVDSMHDAIWATYFHCSSTDADPHHSHCPEGEDSWCF